MPGTNRQEEKSPVLADLIDSDYQKTVGCGIYTQWNFMQP
jgi:hypothetical protein